MKPYLSVIIPAYNEAKRLPLTLIDIDARLSKSDFSYEIIVVDNRSTDATPDIVKRFSHIIKNLRMSECPIPGKGAAVQQGMRDARGTIRLFTDADNSTTVDQFEKMIPYFKEGYGVVIGSRDAPGAELVPPQPWYKQIAGNLGNLVIQALLLPGMWDTQCGFKAFTEEAAERVFPLIKTHRWAFDVEILALTKQFGYRIKEMPVVWINDLSSKVGLKVYPQFLWEVLKIKWWFLRGQYPISK